MTGHRTDQRHTRTHTHTHTHTTQHNTTHMNLGNFSLQVLEKIKSRATFAFSLRILSGGLRHTANEAYTDQETYWPAGDGGGGGSSLGSGMAFVLIWDGRTDGGGLGFFHGIQEWQAGRGWAAALKSGVGFRFWPFQVFALSLLSPRRLAFVFLRVHLRLDPASNFWLRATTPETFLTC
ncbi:hypothetical protein LX36DRAFT_465639 [Colletotrichum falcatum]|nr:hypothetical protein LX36DRAFT_465639 [Colletotrichum falcatum]